jgi:hypothetical protein
VRGIVGDCVLPVLAALTALYLMQNLPAAV